MFFNKPRTLPRNRVGHGILLGAFLPIFMRNNIANPFLLVFAQTMMSLLLYYYYYHNQLTHQNHTLLFPVSPYDGLLYLLYSDFTWIFMSLFPPLCKNISQSLLFFNHCITNKEICLVNIQGLHNVPTDSNQ